MNLPGPASSPDPVEAAQWLKQQAMQLGFDAVGVARAGPAAGSARFRQALHDGRLDPLPYLHQRVEERCDPRVLLPGAQSVVMVLMGYAEPRPPTPHEPHLKVARYAARRDYHNPFIKRLRRLRARIRQRWPHADAYVASDTGAVLERDWAQAAGLGWLGKNAMLLSRAHGSYTLLGSLITTLELAPDAPVADHCGTCTACMDACPTGAITAAGQVDARRCITTHTVETPGPALAPDAPDTHGWVFGCDVCQEVCPWNRQGVLNPALPGRAELAFLPTRLLLDNMAQAVFPTLRGTPLARAGFPGLTRNATHGKAP